jgi:hypothetical protein
VRLLVLLVLVLLVLVLLVLLLLLLVVLLLMAACRAAEVPGLTASCCSSCKQGDGPSRTWHQNNPKIAICKCRKTEIGRWLQVYLDCVG